MPNGSLMRMLGRNSGYHAPAFMGGDSGTMPMGAASPAAAPGGAAASASIGGLDVSGRISAALLMGAVLFLGGVYVATRRVQL